VRLEAVEQAIDAATSAFAAVEPALQKFYFALDDEQKARLLRATGPTPAYGGSHSNCELRPRGFRIPGVATAPAGLGQWSRRRGVRTESD
jgi:hypothetical protein